MQLPTTFFKYCSDNEKVICGIFDRKTIRFTQPAALNDPLEFNPTIRFRKPEDTYLRYVFDGLVFPSHQQWIHHQLIMTQINDYGILSLSRKDDSFDMWNFYANGHQGFLLEFRGDFNTNQCMLGGKNKDELYKVKPVEYVKEYAFLIDDLVNDTTDIVRDEFNECLFYQKSNRWAQEEEWRMVRPLADCPEWTPQNTRISHDRKPYVLDFSLDCLKSEMQKEMQKGSGFNS